MYQVYSDEIRHDGVLRKSGRFPWGSGKRPFQRLEGTPSYPKNAKKLAKQAIKRNREIELSPGEHFGDEYANKPEAQKASENDNKKIDKSKTISNIASATKNILSETSNLTKKLNPESKTVKKAMDLSSLSDEELRQKLTRYNLEKQYVNTFGEDTIVKGKKTVSDYLETAGGIVGIAGGIAGIAVAIKTLRG